MAVLDGASEEINNTLFRKAHNRLGLSSALIGSGMCFSYELFKKNVFQLTTAGEDREMEALLLHQEVFIKYAPDIHVFDEKVSNQDNFQKQRMRWMTAQVQSLLSNLPKIPKAILHGKVNFIDKTIQQALIPRSILFMVREMVDSFWYSGIIPVHRYSSAITNQFLRKSISHPRIGIENAEKRSSHGPQEYRLHSYRTYDIKYRSYE